MVKEDDVHDGFVKGSKGVDQYFIHEPEDHGLQSVDEWSSVQDSAPRAVNKGTTDFNPWGSILICKISLDDDERDEREEGWGGPSGQEGRK